eukprot:INCI14089.3.p1 GENE.INCI14089.3~~INCI14089.3.p1  ORF type:complete len:228 (-),score=31.28 INCI14089.3:378-1061(-)
MPSKSERGLHKPANPNWSTVFLIPNIIGYARIAASFWAFQRFSVLLRPATVANEGSDVGDADARPVVVANFLIVMLCAAFLDVIDGPIARILAQTSTLGVYVDIVADNIWRTACWLSVALTCPHYAWIGLFVIVVEWLTFFASQVAILTKQGASEVQQVHWKTQSATSASLAIRRWYFHNGFRNVVGGIGIAGLFLAPLVIIVDSEFSSEVILAKTGDAGNPPGIEI